MVMTTKESRQGKIREDKMRLNLTIEKEIVEQLRELAIEDNRTLSGMVLHIIKTYAKENYNKN